MEHAALERDDVVVEHVVGQGVEYVLRHHPLYPRHGVGLPAPRLAVAVGFVSIIIFSGIHRGIAAIAAHCQLDMFMHQMCEIPEGIAHKDRGLKLKSHRTTTKRRRHARNNPDFKKTGTTQSRTHVSEGTLTRRR